jgi:hypothetical protein
MEESEVDSEVDFKADSEEVKETLEVITALTTEADSRHARRRSALSARRKDAGQPTILMTSAKPHARNSSLRVTLQVDKHRKTSLCTLQSMKGASTQTSTTRATGTTTMMATMTVLAISNTSNNSSLSSNALQIKYSCITSRATTYTTEARHQHQRHSSCLRTATRDLCTKASYLI